jgi:porphobilinogen synthase
MYPLSRMRRNRASSWVREIVSESHLKPSDLIYPLFVIEGINQQTEIISMPGISRFSPDLIVDQVKRAVDSGIKAIALFPSIDSSLKNAEASEAFNPNNLICRTISAIKKENLDIGIICDVALDPYTNHSHDGIMVGDIIDNDISLEALCKQAVVLAQAGADIVAPSDMMDGRILAIREMLERESFKNTGILSYAAKYASAFYGPFRDAVGSKANLKFGKETYQMDPRNIREALREMEMDIGEGADILMIKPGMPYLDVIKAGADMFDIPIFAYQVSGEYAMMKFASLAGVLNWEKVMLESLISFKRAGASGIFSYAALEIGNIL